MSSQREIRLNAFDMNCVGHQSPGLWTHPRDRSWQYKDLDYWVDWRVCWNAVSSTACLLPTCWASTTC